MRSWRAGLPVNARDRTVSVDVAASSLSVTTPPLVFSDTVSQMEPVHTPSAPSAMAAAIWRPVPMPPAASTGTGAMASTTSGISTIVATSPVWPPAS